MGWGGQTPKGQRARSARVESVSTGYQNCCCKQNKNTRTKHTKRLLGRLREEMNATQNTEPRPPEHSIVTDHKYHKLEAHHSSTKTNQKAHATGTKNEKKKMKNSPSRTLLTPALFPGAAIGWPTGSPLNKTKETIPGTHEKPGRLIVIQNNTFVFLNNEMAKVSSPTIHNLLPPPPHYFDHPKTVPHI